MLGLMAYGISWAAHNSDAASVARQIRMAERAIAASVAALAHELEVVAVWDDAVAFSSPDRFDAVWLDRNVGVWLARMYGHDRVAVLDAQDRPVYAMADGRGGDPAGAADLAAALADLTGEVRARGVVLPDGRARKATGRGVHVSDFRRIAGRPAAVAVMRIVPLSDGVPAPAPGRETLLVGVRYLDGSFLEELRTEHLLDGARFAGPPAPGAGETVLPLTNRHGQVIDHLVWRPEAPGAAVLGTLLPLYLGETAGVLLIMLVLLRVLWTAANDLRATEAEAARLAFFDGLTGHPNRARLMDMLERIQPGGPAGAVAPADRFALLLLDLDRFKQINDTLGHQAGDELIRQFADRLAALVGPGDLIARLWGDEFAVVQFGAADPAAAETLCQSILDSGRRPFSLGGGMQVLVGVSIGVAFGPQDWLGSEDLLRRADIALYRAKMAGRNRYSFFSAEMNEQVRERAMLEMALREALDTREGLTVYFQPQMSQDGGTLTGLEALVRWKHPQHGMMSPGRFLPVAEECGLAVRLDEWVLDYTCSRMKDLPDVPVSVNLSPGQFCTDDLYERIMVIVQHYGVDPRRIELEITEKVLLEENVASHTALRRLREAGFRIALDDFGTGNSSLNYLRRFRVDKIKIDQSFVQHLGKSSESAPLLRAIINLGHAMGLDITAEGVETREQLDFLAQNGCNQMQGYLFAPPVPEERLADFRQTASGSAAAADGSAPTPSAP
ncbi:putative bifunctional diguanylate cyclase/phosphodiesterase [Azospirillum thermophilum]|uniref:putative bifunctional diguanylate cyclase/phosphodiesterase n=1 Tax=Azospirillum thermophilum TaxID=2202148 RepID=UPI00143D9E8F|nr:bifunctional diguanylate cyclase/phosphodiesterase [Azospirillum thermophilum]